MRRTREAPTWALLFGMGALVLALTGCTGSGVVTSSAPPPTQGATPRGGGDTPSGAGDTPSGGSGTPAAQSVAISVAPAEVTLTPGGTAVFAATVTGAADTSVTWAVVEGASGGSVGADGAYRAPQAAGTYRVTATSAADPTRAATAVVNVVAGAAIAVSIQGSASAFACQSATFRATVSGTAAQGVTWSVQEGDAGGTITAAGVYTAPAAAGTYHVVARSLADPTRTAVAAVAVSTKVLSIAVSPATVSLQPGESVQLTATVTTTCGAVVQSGLVSAPPARSTEG